MLRQKKILFFSLVLLGSHAFSAINSEQDKLMQELTGQPTIKVDKVAAVKPVIESASLAARHLRAGQEAAGKKDYILALKHYNTVIVKFKGSPEVAGAYQAKAELYQEMGLEDQAQRNSKLAEASLKITK